MISTRARIDVFGKAPLPPDVLDNLTRREMDVFQLVAVGKKNAQIAEQLCIAEKTVDVHRARLYDRLGLRTSAEIAVLAWRVANEPAATGVAQ